MVSLTGIAVSTQACIHHCFHSTHPHTLKLENHRCCGLQVADALEAIHARLGHAHLALVRQFDPPQWQSDVIAARFPALQVANPPASEHAFGNKLSYSTAGLAQAAAALHGLPATWQPASADAFSCVQSIASILELMSALLASPAVMHHVVSDMDTLITALFKLKPLVTGSGSREVQTLLGMIRGHDEALLQRLEEAEYQEQNSCLLGWLYAWKVWWMTNGNCNTCVALKTLQCEGDYLRREDDMLQVDGKPLW